MEAGELGSAVAPPPFLIKTYDMVDDPTTDAVVSWSKTNNSFVVWNVPEFTRDLLPKYFKHNNFSSFVRQLNTYRFRKVDPDCWEFANEGFLRGHKHLLKTIIRRKPSHTPQPHQQTLQVPNPSIDSCIRVGKFGIEEEVESLKRDKNILMQELVRLRHQQQSTDNQLQTVSQRVHGMEQRQQQMLSFLAKAMRSPGFVAQLIYQKNDDNVKISSENKKRRLPNQDEENSAPRYSITSPDGQIVKYQPLMNEAAKSMLRQIMKINNTSGRLEPKLSNVNGFLIDNVHPPSDLLDSSTSSLSNRLPTVTLSDVLPNTGALTEIQSNNGLPDFVPSIGITLEKNIDYHDHPFMGAESGFVDGQTTVGSNEILADDNVDILVDDVHKMPGINDVFWEQFLSDSPVNGDTQDVYSGKDQVEEEVELDKLKSLSKLTEQMGLLASASQC